MLSTVTYINDYKGISESVTHIETDLNTEPIDIPSIFYKNGYEAGIKRASEIIVQRSKLLGRMLRWPNISLNDTRSILEQITVCVQLGGILRRLIKE